MRRITVQTFLSLDGVMQAPGGPDEDRDGGFTEGGWSFNYWDETMGARMDRFMAQESDLLLGRRTYDIFAAYWPHADHPVITPKFNRARKYVLTHRPESATWENTVPLGPDPVADLRAIKTGDGPDLYVPGSSILVQLLLAHDLVDRFDLWIFPLLLGQGKHLFGASTKPTGLRLESSATSTTGVVISTYVRAERAPVGSFARDTPA